MPGLEVFLHAMHRQLRTLPRAVEERVLLLALGLAGIQGHFVRGSAR